MALPVGILVAIYVNEFARPSIRAGLGLAIDILAGVPAIVIGIFVFVLLVVGSGQSGFKGAFALAILMLPFVTRTTDRGARPRAELAARGEPRPRRSPVADDAERRAAPRDRRHRHRHHPRGRPRRRRDRARCSSPPRSWVLRPTGTRRTPSRRFRSPSSSCPSRRVPTTTRAHGPPGSSCCCSSSSQPGRADAREPKPSQNRRPLMEGAEETMSTSEEVIPTTTIEPTMRVETHRQQMPAREKLETVFHVEGLDAIYGTKAAIKDVSMDVYKHLVTAIIGPSGCGKSTYIRCFNRMNDLIPGFRQTGSITYHGTGHLRRRHRPGRGAAQHRHGLPAAEPVPEVDLRQRRVGLPRARHEERPRRARRARPDAAQRSGTR